MEMLVCRRPQWSRHGLALHLLADPDPSAALDPSEVDLFDLVSRAPRALGALPQATIARWHAAGIVELIAASAARPAARCRLLVIEPHADDATMSAGGAIAAQTDVVILTVAPCSSFTRDALRGHQRLDAATVTRVRLEEAALAARVLGARHRTLGLDEATLRFAPAEQWTDAAFPRLWASFRAAFDAQPFASDVVAWSVHLGRALDAIDPEEVWLPLGVGGHADHRLVRDAALRALVRGARPRRVALYEDLPYAARDPDGATPRVRELTAGGARLVREVHDITTTAALKRRATSVFASQAEPGVLERAIDARAAYEVRWRVDTLAEPTPPALDPFLERCLTSPRPIDRLRILARGPFARPADELAVLLRAFPCATLELHVDARYAWQLRPAPRLTITPLGDTPPIDAHTILTAPHEDQTLAARVLAAGGVVTDALVDLVAPLTYAERRT